MAVYKLFNFGPTRIVEFQGQSFTFAHNISWETKDENQARYITSHYPKIDMVDVKEETPLSKTTIEQPPEPAKKQNVKTIKTKKLKRKIKEI